MTVPQRSPPSSPSALCWSEGLLQSRWSPAESNTAAEWFVLLQLTSRVSASSVSILTLWYSTTSSIKSIPSASGIRTPLFVQSDQRNTGRHNGLTWAVSVFRINRFLLLMRGTTDICSIVFRGACRGISWWTDRQSVISTVMWSQIRVGELHMTLTARDSRADWLEKILNLEIKKWKISVTSVITAFPFSNTTVSFWIQ